METENAAMAYSRCAHLRSRLRPAKCIVRSGGCKPVGGGRSAGRMAVPRHVGAVSLSAAISIGPFATRLAAQTAAPAPYENMPELPHPAFASASTLTCRSDLPSIPRRAIASSASATSKSLKQYCASRADLEINVAHSDTQNHFATISAQGCRLGYYSKSAAI